MAAINNRRVLWGALAGGVVWNIWSVIVNMVALRGRYEAAQQAGTFLKQPRYPFFVGQCIIVLFVLAYIVAWLYASVRAREVQDRRPRRSSACSSVLLRAFPQTLQRPFGRLSVDTSHFGGCWNFGSGRFSQRSWQGGFTVRLLELSGEGGRL
jgi:hypothetical protein